jgi:(S)-citramalyl-CoA lyase
MSAFADTPMSWLFVPGDRPDRFDKALASGAQAVIFDLEDAVAPAAKAQARQAVLTRLSNAPAAGEPQRVVRINPWGGALGRADLTALAAAAGVDRIMMPKTEDATTLFEAAQILDTAGSRATLAALIESARGVGRIEAIVEAAPQRLIALMFGAADYAADLGLQAGARRPDFARDRVVNAAAMGGLAAIDSPFFDMADVEGLLADCAAARAMGFTAKAAIHPSQVGPINAAFAPTAEEVDLARRILAACADGRAGTLDGKMVDEAMARWARRVVARVQP